MTGPVPLERKNPRRSGRLGSLGTVAAAVAVLSSCNPPAPAPGSEGRAYYQALNCRACHRIGEEGSRSGGPDLTFVGLRQSREWLDLWLRDPQAWKKDTLMPNPRLSGKARGALADYLASLKGQAYARGAPWDKTSLKTDPVKRGHMIYSRAGCIACHGRGGSGGYPNINVPGNRIPALNAVSATFAAEELRRKIALGVKPEKADPAGPEPLVRMPAWGSALKPDEIDALIAYLQTLKPSDAQNRDW